MTSSKQKIVTILLQIIGVLFGLFVAIDIAKYITDSPILISKYLKIAVSFLSLILVLISGSDGLNVFDTNKMRLIFVFIFAADLSMYFGQTYIGIILFAICQGLLIWRNGDGLLNKLKYNISDAIVAAIAIIMVITGLILKFFYPILGVNVLLFMFIGYSLLLGLSLWTAIMSWKTQLFPKINSILIAVGMVLFFISDICTGLCIILPDTSFYDKILSIFIWALYAPAIVLLALSTYQLNKNQ